MGKRLAALGVAMTLAGGLPASAGGSARPVPELELQSPASVLASARSAPAPLLPAAALPAANPAEKNRFGSAPDPALTPGVMCTTADKDFAERRYPERIAYCRRNLTTGEKKVVASWYGVPWGRHSEYQFDHLLSLCLGGSNDLRNIWPMPYADARAKARLESALCRRLAAGKVTQKQAVDQELAWFQKALRRSGLQSPAASPPVSRPR